MPFSDYSFPLFPGITPGFNVRLGTAAPTGGTWYIGDMIINQAPARGLPSAWICTVAGAPGTWVPLASVQGGYATQATIGTITAGLSFVVLTSNAAGTYTLPKANSYSPGSVLSLIVTNNVATTFAANTGDEVVGTAAVTAANSSIVFTSSGVSSWYRTTG